MDPTLTQLAHTASLKAFAALRVAVCAVLLLSVQASVIHAQRAPVTTGPTTYRLAETITAPALNGLTFRMRVVLPDDGGASHGKPGPLAAPPVWTVPQTIRQADPFAQPRALSQRLAVLRPGRGPPV